MPKRQREESPFSISAFSPESETQSPYHTEDEPFHSTKYVQTSESDLQHKPAMKCSLPPHTETISFDTFDDFEEHYAKIHAHRCQQCHKNFPSDHLMSLHIEENHDPLVQAKQARGEKTVGFPPLASDEISALMNIQYRCFVEDCDKVCADSKKRRMHLVAKHMFPKVCNAIMVDFNFILTESKNYDFSIVNTGIDRKSSMLRSKARKPSLYKPQSSSSKGKLATRDRTPSQGSDISIQGSPEPVEKSNAVNGTMPNDIQSSAHPDVDALAFGLSELKFVPPSVRFGRGGKPKAFSRT